MATAARRLYLLHVPTRPWEKAFLAVGASVAALANPQRADMVAALGEVTGARALENMRTRLLSSSEGRNLLRLRPLVTGETLAAAADRARCPPGTVGHAYATYLGRNGFDPSARPPVRFVDDDELAYVMTRYRQTHDFWHVLTGLAPTVRDEATLKLIEYRMTGLPSSALASAVAGPALMLLNSNSFGGTNEIRTWLREQVPWALSVGGPRPFWLQLFYEERLEQPVSDLRRELGITVAPGYNAFDCDD